MLPKSQIRTNIGVGIGIALQVVGFLLVQFNDPDSFFLGPPLILISIPVFIWGCMNYAEGKGHSKWVGLVGLAGVLGLMILIILPNQNPDGSAQPMQVHKLVALISIPLGLGILILGRWLDDHEYASIWTSESVRIGQPWPAVCMALGVCIVIGSLVLLMVDKRRD